MSIARFQRAAEYALRVNKMNAEMLLQRVLRGWLTFHIVSTGTMFGTGGGAYFHRAVLLRIFRCWNSFLLKADNGGRRSG